MMKVLVYPQRIVYPYITSPFVCMRLVYVSWVLGNGCYLSITQRVVHETRTPKRALREKKR